MFNLYYVLHVLLKNVRVSSIQKYTRNHEYVLKSKILKYIMSLHLVKISTW